MPLKGVRIKLDNLNGNEKKIIDKYYNEDDGEFTFDEVFEEKLKTSISGMKLEDAAIDNMPNNFFALINKAEEIKASKALFKESVLFIIVASTIIALFVISIFIFGQKPLIYTEITIAVLLPFSLIPLAKNAVKRGEH